MQPKRLLQASCLLLLSVAAVLAQEITPVACLGRRGAASRENCIGATNVPGSSPVLSGCPPEARIIGCLLCTRPELAAEFTCEACKAGQFPNEDGNACLDCPIGSYCPGSKQIECDEGFTTSEDKRWAPSQCDTCWPGFGGSGCGACHPGTAKNVVGTKECSYCLDGFVANAESGATDCLDAAATEEGTKEEACERNEIEGMTVYDEKINACKCEEGLVFTLNSGGDPSCEEPTPTAPSGSTPSGSGSPSGGSPGGKDKDEDDKPNKHGKHHKKHGKHHKKHDDDDEDKYEKDEYEKESYEKEEPEKEYDEDEKEYKEDDEEPKKESYEKDDEKESYEKDDKYAKDEDKYSKKHGKHQKKHGKKHAKKKYDDEEYEKKEDEYEKKEDEYEKEDKYEEEEEYKPSPPPPTPEPKPYESKYEEPKDKKYEPKDKEYEPEKKDEYKPKDY